MFFSRLVNYKRKTLAKSFSDITKSKNKMIAKKYTPLDFDMQYEIIEENIDGLKLVGWLIRHEKATKTIVFVHGRESNKMSLTRFLQLFDDMNLSEKYNIVMFDMRNSGESTKSKTAFGYYYSKDLSQILSSLKSKYGFSDFILYGFSQGGMACMLNAFLYKDYYSLHGIKISKMILDSPISNVKETIINNFKFFKIPTILYLGDLIRFNNFVDGNFDKMCFSELLGDIPTLFIQSEKDKVTTYDIFQKEYEKLKEKLPDEKLDNIEFKIFKNGLHVRMYLTYRWEYTNTVKNFLEKDYDENK